MFSDINAESTRRLTEAKSLVLLIKNEDLMRSLNLDSKAIKFDLKGESLRKKY
jgi:hypothetical protein